MFLFFAILLVLPAAAFFLSRRLALAPEPPLRTALRMLGLFAAGLALASPFLTDRGVGTGEAYNYSLAVADAVTQMRAGEIPPLAGQTEYAFNGRIHPLRNAPYLFYLAGALDELTLHRLNFWELQNLSLAFSLIGAVFTCYAGLRWGTGCSRPAAFALAVLYGLAPGLQAAATVNLFMTVHAAAFVPLAVAACVRYGHRPALVNDAVMAAAVAAAWLAHPPVALWLTISVGVIRLGILWRHPVWQARAGLLASLLLGGALAAFVFASVARLSPSLGFFPPEQIIRDNYVTAIMANLEAAFPGALLPVSEQATTLTDIQFGYAFWLLLAAVVIAAAAGLRRWQGELARSRGWIGLSLIGMIVLLLLLTLPVPHVTEWLWGRMPVSVEVMTTEWPMQRLYLVAAALTVFGAALVLPAALAPGPRGRRLLGALLALALAWSGWEGAKFISRGHAMRWDADASRRSHLASNLDLTVTSYAFFQVPPTFVNGVMDPLFEFSLVKSGRQEIDSPLKAALAQAPVVARGDIFQHAGPSGPAVQVSAQKLVLEPGKRYLLAFDFLAEPFKGTIEIVGPALSRHYALPAAGGPAGFGMGAGHRHVIPLRTSLATPETVEVRLALTPPPPETLPEKIASFTLQAVDPAALPVRIESLLPLRCTVESPETGCFLVTPRSYLPGYEALVNGRTVRPIRAPDGQLMLPVEQGHNVIELRYVGAGIVHFAFWLSVVSWLGFVVWAGGRLAGFSWWALFGRSAARIGRAWQRLRRYRWWMLGAAVAAGGAALAVERSTAYLGSFGPVHLRVLLPPKQLGRQQPLLVTGKTGAGANVFLAYVDENHVSVGADIWGSLYQSDPLPVDYFQEQDLVINSSALYPLDHPRVKALPPSLRDQLRQDFRVELNGRIALAVPRLAFESTVNQVTVGETRIGGSLTQTRFSGEILKVERLPVPRPLVLSRNQDLQLHLRFPTDRGGSTETLVSVGPDGEDGTCSVTYHGNGWVLFAFRQPDGSIVESAEAALDPSADHDLTFAVGQVPGGLPKTAVEWKLDGRHLLGPAKLDPPTHPWPMLAGLARQAVPGVDVRFTGPRLLASTVAKPGTVLSTATFGPRLLVLTFPRNKGGRAEPLLTTGRTGKGDFAYVTYLNDGHVRFGLDHWGVGGASSDPIAIDYRVPHEIEVRLGSLYPDEKDPAWSSAAPAERTRLKSTMEILLDGKSVLTGAFAAYPSALAEITPGLNRIEGSSCDPAFSGEIHSVEVLGLQR